MEDTIKKLFEVEESQLPSSIPLFPLDNVLLLPFGKLPLNIFEERYIKMTLDSLKNTLFGTKNIIIGRTNNFNRLGVVKSKIVGGNLSILYSLLIFNFLRTGFLIILKCNNTLSASCLSKPQTS